MTAQLLINEPPLQVLPSLASIIGLNEAIILQQVHYWLNPNFNKHFIEGRRWVYNSCENWQQQFKFWSKNTIKRAILSLEQKGLLLVSNFNQNKFNHSKWYSIDYEQLQKLEVVSNRLTQNGSIEEPDLGQSKDSDWADPTTQTGPIEEANLGQSLTETTSRDYPETNTHTARAGDPPSGSSPPALSPAQELVLSSTRDQTLSSSQHPAMMLALWNEIVRKSDAPLLLTPDRKQHLAKCLNRSFDQDLDAWKAYCEHIAQTPFLMGHGDKGWKITLNWALVPFNIRKVLEGNFTSGSATPPPPALPPDTEPAVDLIQAPVLWAQVCRQLIQTLGLSCFNSWIAGLIPERLESKRPVLRASGGFARDTIEQRYKFRIEEAFRACNADIEGISIEIVPLSITPENAHD